MKRKSAIICLLIFSAFVRAQEPSVPPAYDSKFVQALQQTSAFDLEACKLAQEKAVSTEVQSFAAAELKSRSEKDAELSTLASTKNFTNIPGKNPVWERDLNELNAKSGSDFDQAFLTDMIFVRLNDKTNATLEIKSGQDGDSRALADKIHSSALSDVATITQLLGKLKRNSGNTPNNSLGN